MYLCTYRITVLWLEHMLATFVAKQGTCTQVHTLPVNNTYSGISIHASLPEGLYTEYLAPHVLMDTSNVTMYLTLEICMYFKFPFHLPSCQQLSYLFPTSQRMSLFLLLTLFCLSSLFPHYTPSSTQ